MPTIVPQGTDTQDQNTVLESLDWQPPCEYVDHERRGDGGPAVLAILVGPDPCGCRPARTLLNCEPCFEHWFSKRHGGLFCVHCGTIESDIQVIRVERI